MRRFTIQLEDAEFEILARYAAQEDRPVAVQAARYVRMAIGPVTVAEVVDSEPEYRWGPAIDREKPDPDPEGA